MTETATNNNEGKLPFVLTFSYTEKLMGQMLVYATSAENIELEIGEEFRAFIPDFSIEDAQQITEEEADKIKATMAEQHEPKLN